MTYLLVISNRLAFAIKDEKPRASRALVYTTNENIFRRCHNVLG